MKRFPSALLLTLAGLASTSPTAQAQAPARATPITLYVGQAHVLDEPGVRRIAVGNGRVLQATALDERQVLVLPEAPGQSTLTLWGRSGPERTWVFHVVPADTGRLLDEVRAMLGTGSRASARVVGDKVVVEGPEVTEEQAQRIAEVARRHPQVVNLVPRVGLERMIAMDVKFVEIRRELLENIGVKWGGAAQGPSFQVLGDLHRSAPLRPGGAGEAAGLEVRPRVPPFATALSWAGSLASTLNLLVQRGDAVILAEPRLSCRSGGSARFVAGGELPIPVAGALGTASVSFKEFGIKFDVSPVASDSGVIAARIATEISSINFEVTVREVPGLTKRRAETDVNLRENETLVIAGLLSDESSRTVDRVPGAGDVPVLGPLFRSRLFRDRQTELAVFVTPRFVSGAPMSPDAAAMVPSRIETPEPPVPASGGARRLLDGGRAPLPEPFFPHSGEPMSATTPSDTSDAVPVPTRSTTTDAPDAHASPPHHSADPADPGARMPQPAARGAPPEAASRGEDRGTARRHRAARERLRMVE